MPIFYECQRCTACCRWPGQVKLATHEISRIAAYLELDDRTFIETHTRLRPDRTGLALNDRPDGSCIFLENNACAVQPVKPRQCRDFPNLWNFPGFDRICRAIPKEIADPREYARKLAGESAKPGSVEDGSGKGTGDDAGFDSHADGILNPQRSRPENFDEPRGSLRLDPRNPSPDP